MLNAVHFSKRSILQWGETIASAHLSQAQDIRHVCGQMAAKMADWQMQATRINKKAIKKDTKTQICTCFKFSFISFSLAWKGSKSRAEHTWIGTSFGTSQDATTKYDKPEWWPETRRTTRRVRRHETFIRSSLNCCRAVTHTTASAVAVIVALCKNACPAFQSYFLHFWFRISISPMKKVRHNKKHCRDNQHLHLSALRLEVQSRGEQVLQNYFQPHISSS